MLWSLTTLITAIHGAALENHLETSTGTGNDSACNLGDPTGCLCYTIIFLGAIQGTCYHF